MGSVLSKNDYTNNNKRHFILSWLYTIKNALDYTTLSKFTSTIIIKNNLTININTLSEKKLQEWACLIKDIKLISDTKLIKFLRLYLNNKKNKKQQISQL